VISLLEIVLGPLWVWLAYEERPTTATLIGGLVVVGAVVVQSWAPSPRESGSREAAEARGSRREQTLAESVPEAHV
jgi:hypothetical protein